MIAVVQKTIGMKAAEIVSFKQADKHALLSGNYI
jgi:hypothetical protein